MVVYSIRDLEKLTGVKAHTIRIWEKRYDLLQPKRTKTNIRYYTDKDLRHILNVSILYKQGYKISKIAVMSQDIIKTKVAHYSNINLSFEDQLDALILFVLELDHINFNKILDQYIDQIGLERTMNELIYPLLDKLSIAWLAGSLQSVHESFVIQIIKSKIIASTEALKLTDNCYPKFLIFLPEGEKQELSLLYIHYVLKKNNCNVINLGTDVGLDDIKTAYEISKSDYLFTIVNESLNNKQLKTFIEVTTDLIENGILLLTGFQAVKYTHTLPANCKLLNSIEDCFKYLEVAEIV